ncbi:DUF943 family protein [Kosakonia sp. CFBP8986]|uniref:DUF943 family protein n=1 Tax=Kosakonia sp. CFBP8986 TaxID=3096524 RepID=UPI002A69B4B1|nr:DUF943 family protein [Kosakonia sp. CFBP8986]MDY0889496.1 DUF943 family protein [Kosakonia sp. CFBP8986]
MKKGISICCFMAGALLIFYYVFITVPVKIIAIHKDNYAPVVVVDRLPLSDAKKIAWWRDESKNILANEDDAQIHNRALNYYIYRFGEGYQESGKEDRLCFDDMKEPKNCLDKDILMIVRYRKNGDIQFDIDDDAYILRQSGGLKKVD